MDFGQFNLMSYRDAGTRAADVYDLAVAQVKAAEQAGFSTAWFAEHHFSNYSVCPSPLMMVARCAGETSRIKLASGVVIVPMYQPARLLSEVGMADALTHGRLVLGIGNGYQPYEFERFGEDLKDATAKTLEFMEMLDRALTSDTFSFSGQHYQMAETHIASRPMRPGVPPVWVAGDNPALHQLAARKGWPVMVTPRHFTPALLAAAKAKLATTWSAAGANPAAMRFATLRHMCVTDDKAEAMHFLDHVRYQMRMSQNLRLREQALQGGILVEKPWVGEPTLEEMAESFMVGDAHTIAERLVAEIKAANPCHYLLQFQASGTNLALALRSIERFATQVKPLLEQALGPLDRIGEPVAAPDPRRRDRRSGESVAQKVSA
jgi:alkanesulfonate monooxygenase SsuD/methylene tetrahydromethanopterin reductase-like flavin-dependent oxidoreductase (luciferase family)